MKKYKNFRFVIALLAIAVWLFMVPSVAYAATGTELLGISAYYAKNITPQKGDTFAIDYQNRDTGETGRITIDAFDVTERYKDYDLKYGYYEVVRLQYTGTNDIILQEGFGTKRTFAIYEDDDDLLDIYIGKSKVSSLDALYNNAFIIDEEHDEHGKRVVFYDEGGRPYRIDKENGEVGYEYLDATEPSGSAAVPTEPATEYIQEIDPPKSDEAPATSTGTPLAVLAVIALVGCGALYWFRKKGKQ